MPRNAGGTKATLCRLRKGCWPSAARRPRWCYWVTVGHSLLSTGTQENGAFPRSPRNLPSIRAHATLTTGKTFACAVKGPKENDAGTDHEPAVDTYTPSMRTQQPRQRCLMYEASLVAGFHRNQVAWCCHNGCQESFDIQPMQRGGRGSRFEVERV